MDYKNPFFLTVLDKGYNSLDAARSFYNNGASVELIAKSLGMTAEEVMKVVGDNA